ncbi:hypothetical protein [Priestia abyssalis]|uniref:hypothetical protein n=1 Tax=Priestia abyssalis TaxID=1221450 RepID=UPI000994A750|nr:hypothetical protein [Priestia abyssalis]
MKQRLLFNMAERGVILTAMKSYIRNVKGPYKPLFEMTLNKVQQAQFPSLDGMEMICIVTALTWRSGVFMEMRKRTEQLLYLDLANRIDEIRYEFQYQNAPVIIKAERVGVPCTSMSV